MIQCGRMTYPNPDPYQPLNYNYGAPVASPRPTAVTVLAVLGIVLASLGILMRLCGGVGIFIAATGMTTAGNATTVPAVPQMTTVALITSVVTQVVYLVLNTSILVAAIGMLKLSPWARRATVVLSVIELLIIAVGVGMFFWNYGEMQATMNATIAQQRQAGGPALPASVFQAGIFFGLTVILLAAVLPICNLMILPKVRIKSAFGEN